MKMRNATNCDIDAILKLIEQNNVNRQANVTTGLIEYQADPSLIRKAIASKDSYSIILEGENEQDLIGFMLGYKKSFLKQAEFKKDEIVQHLLNNILYDFVYADILVIDKEHQDKQYGKMLMLSFIDDCKKDTIITAVAHTPIRNEASIKLIKSFRFTEETEITVYDGLTFGIYELDN